MAEKNLTAERAREVLSYDPDNGTLIRRVSLGSRSKKGSTAGTVNKGGYLVTQVDGKLYYVHRLVWLIHYGEWPRLIDHINGNRSDNRASNLRSVSRFENAQNLIRPKRTNTSGYLGVSRRKNGWFAQIVAGPIHQWVGPFECPEQAYIAYLTNKRIHHPGCTI